MHRKRGSYHYEEICIGNMAQGSKEIGGELHSDNVSTRFRVKPYTKNTYRFPKEDNIRLDKPFTCFTPRNTFFFDEFFHLTVTE
jgi:hypothetical protein